MLKKFFLAGGLATAALPWDFNHGQVTVFAGEITGGSDDYNMNHDGTDYFTVKFVDGSTSGRSGDIIAVLARTDATTTRDYPMTADAAGSVTAGNLTVF